MALRLYLQKGLLTEEHFSIVKTMFIENFLIRSSNASWSTNSKFWVFEVNDELFESDFLCFESKILPMVRVAIRSKCSSTTFAKYHSTMVIMHYDKQSHELIKLSRSITAPDFAHSEEVKRLDANIREVLNVMPAPLEYDIESIVQKAAQPYKSDTGQDGSYITHLSTTQVAVLALAGNLCFS